MKMNILKRTAGGLLAVLLCAMLVVPVSAARSVGILIDGQAVAFNEEYGYPFIDSADRTQVPFRITLETFGCEVSWEQETHTAIAEKDGITVRVPIGQPCIVVDGQNVAIDTVSVLVNDRTYLPIRAVLEAFGAQVSWDQANWQVIVSTAGAPSLSLQVHFIDVGQGDSTLIDMGETEVLIDGGDNKAGSTVVSYIAPYVDGKLDYVIATHPDADHIGGLDDVLAAYDVGEVIDGGYRTTSKTYQSYWTAVLSEPGCILSYDENRVIPLGTNTFLSIIETGDNWKNPNDSSVIAELICEDVTVLFTGDMSETVEKASLSLFGDVDVLKVGHHGSATSTCTEFLKVVKPEYAVASYKVGNTYHHPTGAALQRLFAAGTTVFGTGKSGSIVMSTDGHTYSFNTTLALTAADAGVR